MGHCNFQNGMWQAKTPEVTFGQARIANTARAKGGGRVIRGRDVRLRGVAVQAGQDMRQRGSDAIRAATTPRAQAPQGFR